MVLVVVRGCDSVIEGTAEPNKGTRPSQPERACFQLGATMKIFAIEVLASLVVDGTVRVTGPRREYVGTVMVRTMNGAAPITLFDLATGTAGRPGEMGFARP
jgi:CubicO group peptidase (beta-lactamase class C family)